MSREPDVQNHHETRVSCETDCLDSKDLKFSNIIVTLNMNILRDLKCQCGYILVHNFVMVRGLDFGGGSTIYFDFTTQ